MATKTELEQENSELKIKLSGIEQMLKELVEKKSETKTEVVEDKDDDDLTPIKPNKYIRVTSLCTGNLNLCPEQHGGGNPVNFYSFGQTRNVTYETLEKIVSANRKMAENGRYFIQDKQAVKLLMLEDVYEKILDENKMQAIVNSKLPNLLEVFKITPKKQQESIVDMIVKKVVDGGQVDYNQLHLISEIYGKDLIERINDAKKL